MAYYTYTKDPIGVFVEKDTGNYFEVATTMIRSVCAKTFHTRFG